MQRTRRRWAVMAVLVLVAANLTGSVPDIQRRGWIAAIPDSLLVLSIPLMSDEPGSSFDWSIWGPGAGSGIVKRVEGRIRTMPWSERRAGCRTG
jgi:hypothetical protein